MIALPVPNPTTFAKNIDTIQGSGIALAIGVVGALWGGLGVTAAAQNAKNEIWDVPRKDRPNFVESKLLGLLILAVLGSPTIVSTVLAAFASAGGAFFRSRSWGWPARSWRTWPSS